MRFFLDSSDLQEISDVLDRGFGQGLTTNPSQIRSFVDRDPIAYLRQIIELIEGYEAAWPVSAQVMTFDPNEMFRQAHTLIESLAYGQLVIKIPCGWENLSVIRRLSREGISINSTACITQSQAILAASAGARYVSMFYGKMSDCGIEASRMLASTVRALRNYDTELIVASIRKTYDLHEIAESGAHIASVPLPFLSKIADHHKTSEAVEAFGRGFLAI
jgi:transaldolase